MSLVRELYRPGLTQPFEQMLRSYAPLTADEMVAVREALGDPQAHPPERQLARGKPGAAPLVIIDGWVGTVEALEDGRRQIVSLFVAGDVLDPGEDCAVGLVAATLTSVTVVDASALKALIENDSAPPNLTRAWKAARLAAQLRLVRHVVRLGRMSAFERTAEFMLELLDRQRRSGLSHEGRIELPLTQEMLADHLGLSVVHMNRTLQQLRREGLIVYRAGRATIPSASRLALATPRASH